MLARNQSHQAVGVDPAALCQSNGSFEIGFLGAILYCAVRGTSFTQKPGANAFLEVVDFGSRFGVSIIEQNTHFHTLAIRQ